jgi:D-glycero-alpha-D-manno-heptose-7-phosphate kinase
MRNCLQKGKLARVGDLLHEGWELKKAHSKSISNNRVDEIYSAARDSGAKGGKLLGAGGGGHLLFFCHPTDRYLVVGKLREMGLSPMQVKFDTQGLQVGRSTVPERSETGDG